MPSFKHHVRASNPKCILKKNTREVCKLVCETAGCSAGSLSVVTAHAMMSSRGGSRSPSPPSTSPRLRWRDELEDTHIIPARGDWRYAVTDMPFPTLHSNVSELEENTDTTDSDTEIESVTYNESDNDLDAWANLSTNSAAMESYSYDHDHVALEHRLSFFLQSCSAGGL